MSNWKFEAVGMTGGLIETDEEPDGDTAFPTFTQARTALADWFEYVAQAYMEAAKRARKLRKPAGGTSVSIPSV